MLWWNRSARPQQPSSSEATPAGQKAVALRLAIPPAHAKLWEKLAAFPIDDPAAEFPLSKRLAKEQEWSHELALRVVEEYRKFLFLSMVSPQMVTPSLRVDEAWHLHLLYTRSYWQELCVKTLGRLIHHQPSTGGKQEDERFSDLYDRTLELYTEFFGEPPHDIWGCCHRAKTGLVAGNAQLPSFSEDESVLFEMIGQAAERINKNAV